MIKKLRKYGCVLLSLICMACAGCSNTDPEMPVDDEDKEESAGMKYSLLEVAQRLQNSEYTDPSLTDDCYGLSEASNVGVDEESFDDVLYPIPDDA